jgi:D-glycero-alpha-D-manno-heptose-7-phosphate kinase
MIISRTPFRVSFVGGGTDLPDFYLKEGGAVVSCAIDKYMYICVSPNFHGKWKVSYSQTEYADSVDGIQHQIVRETLKCMDIKEPLDIVSISDMPAGSGIGSSSAYTVGLLNALFAYKGKKASKRELAQSACNIEIDLCKEPIGIQDQYAVSWGGLNYMQFKRDEAVAVERIEYPWINVLEDSLLLMFTGDTRQAGKILNEVKKRVDEKRSCLSQMRSVADMLYYEMQTNCPPANVSDFMNEGWELKKQLANSVTNPKIDELRQCGLDNGALGCKLLGAGAEGFMLFYCDKEKQAKLKRAFPNMKFIKFGIDMDGSKIIYKE